MSEVKRYKSNKKDTGSAWENSPPALKHGAYSAMTVLPGEDAAAFEELRREIIAELEPVGPLEQDCAEDVACLMWRKRNLKTYKIARLAKSRHQAVINELMPKVDHSFSVMDDDGVVYDHSDPQQVQEATEAAEQQTRKELGAAWELVEIGEFVDFDYLHKECSIAENIDGAIGRRIKRLLHIKGIKSLMVAPSGALARNRLPPSNDRDND